MKLYLLLLAFSYACGERSAQVPGGIEAGVYHVEGSKELKNIMWRNYSATWEVTRYDNGVVSVRIGSGSFVGFDKGGPLRLERKLHGITYSATLRHTLGGFKAVLSQDGAAIKGFVVAEKIGEP